MRVGSRDLQNQISILTTEIEHINADAVEAAAESNGLEMEPTPHTIRIIQVSCSHVMPHTHTHTHIGWLAHTHTHTHTHTHIGWLA